MFAVNYPQILMKTIAGLDEESIEACEEGKCIMFVPENWGTESPYLRLVPMSWDVSLDYGIYYKKNPSNNVKEIISMMDTISNMK